MVYAPGANIMCNDVNFLRLELPAMHSALVSIKEDMMFRDMACLAECTPRALPTLVYGECEAEVYDPLGHIRT